MASSMIHLAVVQEMMKEVSFRDIARLRLGVILPDGAVEGNSHLKKKICENQDMLYRRFLYGEHGWNSSIPGNVEKLHRDYEILNGYVAEKYGLSREMVQEIDLADEPLAQLAEFDAKGLAEEVRGEFAPMEEEELSVFTKEMADEYITRAVKFCVEEMKTLSAGKSGLDSTAWSWEKPENKS